jgi:hypothetical protein
MTWIKKIAAELFGLFVDDVRFAVTIIGWIGFNWLLWRHLLIQMNWSVVILPGGLGVILIWSAVRRAGH